MLSLQALVNAMARAGGGVLGERVEPRRLVIGALALTAIGIAALAAARSYPLMLTYVLGVGIGYGVSYLATILLLLNYFGRRRNLELFSIMCLVSTLAAGGPWLAGFMRDRFGGFEGAFWLFAGVGGSGDAGGDRDAAAETNHPSLVILGASGAGVRGPSQRDARSC